MPQTVMVVDDDVDIVDMTRLILEGGGYRVVPARSGPEALQKLEQGHPDLILLDINMPEMDGWQVLRALKVDERSAGIPVAMFSIKMEVRDKLHGLQEGAYDYINKPFSCEDLLGRVRRIFETLERRQVAG
ncbi:MAG TPA: response regulator [Candidatus Polarisedimenticolia bacterium]|nr:response regulator [Candidatus Polarisedimenticolia bacterium]